MKWIFISILCVLVSSASAQESLTTSSTSLDRIKKPVEGLRVSADLRLRHEHLDFEGSDPRGRQRIRARLGADFQADESMLLGFRVATGGTGITSTNQTLDDGFANKEFGVDLAYVKWDAVKGVSFLGGKMKNPFFRSMKSSLVWDSDVTPEGAAVKAKLNVSGAKVFSNIGGFVLEERSADENALVYGGQVGFDSKKTSVGQFVAGAGAYIFAGIQNQNVIANSAKSFGNTVNNVSASAVQNQLVNDFHVYNAFFQYKAKISNIPVSVGADFIYNGAIDNDNVGYLGAIKFGSKKLSLPLTASYTYRLVESDATLGSLTDSDVFNGGTDGKGHLIQSAYHFSKNASAGTSLFLSQIGLDTPENFVRAMFDLKFKL